MTSVKEVVLSSGRTGYRFVLDVSVTGRRRQITRTYSTYEEAAERLAEYVAARDKRRRPEGTFAVVDLFVDGLCHPMCVFAWGSEKDDCICACAGRFHGNLTELHANWAQMEIAGPARKRRQRSARLTPEMRVKVLTLHAEALVTPAYRFRPATYIREQLAAGGAVVTQAQVNSWLQVARRNGAMPTT